MSAPSSTSATASAPTASPTGSGGGGNGPSSPLLFFVALGFGVVFTNLWIIVGVKYCFRYNQRNRRRMAGEDPDAVDLGAMPRQHRRRREKKLMSMEEVNEKFPLTKYKTWRSNRAQEGLPTAGGITTTAASRPASIHHAASRPASIHQEKSESKDEAITREIAHASTFSTTDEKPESADHGRPEVVHEDTTKQDATGASSNDQRPTTSHSNTNPPDTPIKKVETADEEGDEEDEPIQTAVPAEQLPDPGDACAICIDTIEDEDDVRGLHCGHAFHASCVDPWLTSRRACCPLCKADYYVPKPRAEGESDDPRRRGARGDGINMPPPPPHLAFISGGRTGAWGARRPTMVLPGRFMSIVYDERDRYGFPVVRREERPPRPSRAERRAAGQPSATGVVDGDQTDGQQQVPEQRGWRQRMAGVRIPNPIGRMRGDRGEEQQSQPQTQTENTASDSTSTPTPAQLEAGRS